LNSQSQGSTLTKHASRRQKCPNQATLPDGAGLGMGGDLG
jgi:hypothetical protein